MNDLDELTHYLHARAGAADLGHTPVRVIARAGIRRRNRHRAVSTAGVLAVGALGTVATVQVLGAGDGSPRQVTTDPVATDPTSPVSTILPAPAVSAVPAADNTLAPSPLVWNPVDVDSAETLNTLSWITDTTSNNELGPYYRYATAPGRAATETPGFYRSADGIHWEHVGDEDPDRPVGVYSGRSVGSVGGRRYVLGSQYSEAAVALEPPTVDVSDDGVAWQERALPFDLESLASQPGVSGIRFESGGVAGQGTTAVVGALVTTRVDEASVAELLGAPGSIGRDEEGVGFVQYETTPIDCAELRGLLDEWQQRTIDDDALDEAGVAAPPPPRPGAQVSPDECYRWGAELRRISPDEIGLTAEAFDAALGTPLLFTSTDDGDFVRVSAPRPPAGEQVARFGIVADDEGYVAVISTYQGIHAYRTDAGFTAWRQIEDPSRTDGSSAMLGSIGSVGGNVVMIYPGAGEATMSTLQGDTWVSRTTADLLPDDAPALQWNQVAVGTNGVGLVGSSYPPSQDSSPVLLYSPDGVAWSAVDLSTVTDMSNRLVTGLMFTGDRVLVTVREMTDLDNRDAPLPGSTVLVGTLA